MHMGKVRIWVATVAILICHCVAASTSSAASSPATFLRPARANYSSGLRDDFTTLSLDLRQKVTADAYHQLLEAIRSIVAPRSTAKARGFRVTRLLRLIPPSERFIMVAITSGSGLTVTIAIDTYTSYIAAYEADGNAYVLSDAKAAAYPLFPHTIQYSIKMGSTNYQNLENIAGANRAQIVLGFNALTNAINNLYRTNSVSDSTIARALLVVCQMISDAARYYSIELRISVNIDSGSPWAPTVGSFNPDSQMVYLEDNWVLLSQDIQTSNQGVLGLTVGPFSCVRDVLRSVVAFLYMTTCMSQGCQPPEPMYFIQGGVAGSSAISGAPYCMDVSAAKYVDGNPVLSWSCNKKEMIVNQGWAIKRDGTIRSNNDWCLGVPPSQLGLSSGGQNAAVQIFNCDTTIKEAIRWKIFTENKTILHAYTKRPLGVDPSQGPYGKLALVDDSRALLNYWDFDATNGALLQNAVVTIVGMNNLCLTSVLQWPPGHDVFLDKCDSPNNRADWGLIGSGMILASGDYQACLTCCADQSDPSRVTLQTCGDPSFAAYQTWEFQFDGTIVNKYNGMVLDVFGGDPSAKKIITFQYKASFNQMWRVDLYNA